MHSAVRQKYLSFSGIERGGGRPIFACLARKKEGSVSRTPKKGGFFPVPVAPTVVDVLSPKLFSPREGRDGKE